MRTDELSGAAKLPLLTHLEQTMTTLTNPTSFTRPTADFVSTDTAALASHMDHCASNRSRFFGLHAALEMAQAVVFSRMVTAAVVAAALLAMVGIV